MATMTKALLMLPIDDDCKDDKIYSKDEKNDGKDDKYYGKDEKLWQG